MSAPAVNDLELAPAEVVQLAARDFAAALAETPHYKAYEQAEARLQADATAQAAMQAFQQRQNDLQVVLALGGASLEEQAELNQLREAFLSAPSVMTYFKAQADLQAVCQVTGDQLSQATGLDFGAACRSGCC